MAKNGTSLKALAFAAMSLAATATAAAPVSYTFTTGQTAYQGTVSGFPPGTFLPPLSFVGGVSGSFNYDSAGSFVQFNADGSSSYAGFTSPSVTGLTPSISGLSATANTGGLTPVFNPDGTISYVVSSSPLPFSDANGSTSIWNDNANNFFGSPGLNDALILSFDPPASSGNTLPRNLVGFDIDGWHLYSARMIWVEGMIANSPEGPNPNIGTPIGDFLANQSLPGTLPSFEGRLWLELQNNANPSQIRFAFYNNLQVAPTVAAIPEPETYAMLLAGLGIMGFVVRRRRRRAEAA